ncbi:MAG: UDP-3-O-(3-hydroxymyristoyl)glucosamine N-acyltransferase [Methyloligellaceae bacterium]
MEHPGFFDRAGPFSIQQIAEATGAEAGAGVNPDILIEDIRTLEKAGPKHIAFLDNKKYISQFSETSAGACFVTPDNADKAPETLATLLSAQPYHCFARTLSLFYPQSRFSQTAIGSGYNSSNIHPSAVLEEGVIVEPNAVIGPEVHIGKGTRIAAGAVIGYRVYIGRDCYIGPNANIVHSLIGDRVIIHAGVCSGQDGFGFAMGAGGHLKIPQIGRVIIQDDVEIGANSAIDRGALGDTIIGQGTKLDNMIQVAHNATLGTHCVAAAQTGISGSTILGDYVVLGGQVGVVGHLNVGSGTQVAAKSAVTKDLPPGRQWSGIPAEPVKDWRRGVAILRRMIKTSRSSNN